MKLAAVRYYGKAIEYISCASEEMKFIAVKQNGCAIKHISDPSEEIQLAAVHQNGLAIRYIIDPSEEVQLAAVHQNGHAIKRINNPSKKVKLASLWNHKTRVRLKLPILYYIWEHNTFTSDLNYFKKNILIAEKKSKYFNIKISTYKN